MTITVIITAIVLYLILKGVNYIKSQNNEINYDWTGEKDD